MRKRILIYLNLIFIFILAVIYIQEFSQTFYVKESLSPTQLAKISVEKYIKEGKIVKLRGNLAGTQTQKAGVFVTIRNHGDLRGCMGTIQPVRKSIKEEIVLNAISSATEDKRFGKITAEELGDLQYTVDILSQPEKIKSNNDLAPKKYGVLLKTNSGKLGVLLPDIKGIDTIEKQFLHARNNGGIKPGEEVETSRFTAERFSD